MDQTTPEHGLTPAVLAAEAILRAVARDNAPTAPAAIAAEANRPTKNIGRELASAIAAGLLDADNRITEAGRAGVAALDRAAGKGDAIIITGQADVVPHHLIFPDPDQPRKVFRDAELDELADSIRDKGLLQPIILRPHPRPEGLPEGAMMIIGGERRWRAIGRLIERTEWAILENVPHTVRRMDDGEAAVAALLENVQRADLTALEKFDAYQRLIDLNSDWPEEDATQRLADLISKSRRHVQDILRLALLTPDERRQMAEGKLTLEQARAALKNRKAPIDMPPARLLMLAEVFHAANGFDPHPAYYRTADRAPGSEADDRIDGLAAEGLLTFTGPHADDGQYKVALTWEGWQRLAQLAPDILKADRSAALLALRAKVGGADAAEAADSDGKHLTPWLNGPFELTEEGRAKIEEAKAARAQREEEDRRREAEQEERAKARETARVQARQLARDFRLVKAGEGSRAPLLQSIAAAFEHPFPWRLVPAANGAMEHLRDADGNPVHLEYSFALTPIIMAALNAAAGFDPLVGPMPGEEPAAEEADPDDEADEAPAVLEEA